MSQITTHVLDTSTGRPAQGIKVILSRFVSGAWEELATGVTDSDGRLGDLLELDTRVEAGIYQLLFATGEYFDLRSQPSFYPEVSIVFKTVDREHYHVPLLLNPYGYSTYRGS